MSSKTKRAAILGDKNVSDIGVGHHIKESMREYGTYVIEDRAVPDFRDGCKPSQRRILYSMKVLGITPTGNTFKCARIVGDCIGRYHPHGDSALYGTLVEMAWARYSLIDFRGNKGTELLPAAAYRYTEARFSKMAEDHLACLDVADMVDNFSADTKEPVVINTRLPYLLMNGASGIAVGMSTNIPSHNLKELVNALTYVAKSGKDATVEGIMEYIEGPDQRAGGRLLSPKKEVLNVYKQGQGKLEFACEYRIEKNDDVTNIIVYGFPDKFSIPSFLKKCGELIEKRSIKYAETDEEIPQGKSNRNDSRFIIRVGVDNKTALEKVVKMLHCSESYQFNVTVRHSDHTELRSMNILALMRGWVKWRKREEKKMLELEKTQQEASLRREELRLKGMLNIDAVLAAVKQSKVDPAEHLSKAIKISLEDAQFIGSIPVFQLKKANVDEQKSKIAKIKSEIARIEDDLLHLTRVVIKNLKRLEQFFDERRTKLGTKGRVQLANFETTGEPIVCAASTDGKLFAHLDEKGTTNADLVAVGTFSGCVLFSKSGVVCYLSPSEMQGKAGVAYVNCVGVAPQETSHIIGIGKNGYCVKTKMQQKRAEFPLIKGAELVFGGGLNDDSKILVWGKSEEEFAVIASKKIAETRSNVAGKKLVNFKPKKSVVLHAGQSLCMADGSSVSAQHAQEYFKDKLYVLDKRNVVFLKSGKRKFMNDKEAKKMLASKDAKSVYPVTIPESK